MLPPTSAGPRGGRGLCVAGGGNCYYCYFFFLISDQVLRNFSSFPKFFVTTEKLVNTKNLGREVKFRAA